MIISDARDFSPDLRGNLETQIANVADELAYTTHDLDDGLRSAMITPLMLDGIPDGKFCGKLINGADPLWTISSVIA